MTELSDRDYRRDFYRAVEQRQATDERQGQFYVPIYDNPALKPYDIVSTLKDGIEFSVGESVQILSGFRGSGKTSELMRLRDELKRDGYAVVFLDIEDYFNTELPVEGAAFELALAAGFAEAAQAQQALKPDGPDFFGRLRNFFSRIDVEVGAAVGPLDIKASLRDDESFRAKVAAALRNSRRKFREELHTFFEDSAAAINNPLGVVFIVDSIDHFRGRAERFHEVRESVEMLFSEGAEDLKLPRLNVIYTVPVYVQPALGLRRDILNIKVADKDGSPFEPGMGALRAVLAKRAPDGDVHRLLGPYVDRVLNHSGGLIRDLLRLTSEIALVATAIPVSETELLRAESTVRANMQLSLSQEQVEILQRVRDSNELIPTRDGWSDAIDLMARGAVLRYPNGEQPWFGVHPLLMPLLDDES
ncbi:MAG TPA: hypothetical protein VMB79_07390 [Jatrophihabitans sp.]|nr:hypothetical protein [Jatrophihabitans sp.]